MNRKTMSFDNMRVGKSYFVKNYGEKTSFLVMQTEGRNNFKIKDLLSLETSLFGDLIQYGIGEDFELYEL